MTAFMENLAAGPPGGTRLLAFGFVDSVLLEYLIFLGALLLITGVLVLWAAKVRKATRGSRGRRRKRRRSPEEKAAAQARAELRADANRDVAGPGPADKEVPKHYQH